MRCVSMPASCSAVSSAGRCSAATVSSVTIIARFCGSTGASRRPARAINPSPMVMSYSRHSSATRTLRCAPCAARAASTLRVVCSVLSSSQSITMSASA